MTDASSSRSASWKWHICGLLFLASAINYLDRQTLASAAVQIQKDLKLNDERYGNLEQAFGYAFPVGGLLFGVLADVVSIRWLYPAVLLLWSGVGFATGFAETYEHLLICRTLLGLFEAGHWPCALKTTQWILERKDRGLGNSLLQGGASLGAIITPLIMVHYLTQQPPDWRTPFMLLGAVGSLWIVLWLASVRGGELVAPASSPQAAPEVSAAERRTFWQAVFSPRFVVLAVLVASINTPWQVIRVWLVKFLHEARGYPQEEAIGFTSIYYVATEAGVLVAGFATLLLFRHGMSVHRSRCVVFLGCALLCALTVVAVHLGPGWPLLLVLCLIGFGTLGLFPCEYSFSQELTTRHQGKVSGLLGVFAWIVPAPLQPVIGRHIDAVKAAEGATHAYDLPFTLVALAPLAGFLVLIALWNRDRSDT